MTKDQMLAVLAELGLKKKFKPYCEDESGTILLATKHPAQIVEGWLEGCEISLRDGGMFCVWTHQLIKAKRLAMLHGLKIRLLDGEVELYVPATLADSILPTLGAKVSKEYTPEQRETMRARMLRVRDARNASILSPTPRQNDGFTGLRPQERE